MILTNHHAHCTFSDGKAPAEDFIQRAIELGMTTYGYSDHAPVPIDDFGNMPMQQLAAYGQEVDRLKDKYADKIEIFKSLEVDFIPGYLNVDSPHIKAVGLDYSIGAVHYVEELDGKPWSFQKPEPFFKRGIDEIFGGSARAMIERYFELVREMLDTAPPDVIAHLDRIKKRNENGKYWDENASWFQEQVRLTLDKVKQVGCIMEVNTRGLYRGDLDATYPSPWIVAEAHKRGIRLQVNSDTHELDHITGGFAAAYQLLRKIGVAQESVFRRDRGFVEVGLTD